MKKMVVVILTLISSLVTIGANSALPVLDTEGNNLNRNDEYYVWPVGFSNSGAFTFQSRTNDPCPVYLGLGNINASNHAVRFEPRNGDQEVLLDTNFKVIFNYGTECNQTLMWKMEDLSIENRRAIGFNETTWPSLSNRFKIMPFPGINSTYMIYWCPLQFEPVYCSFLGLQLVNGKKMVALDGYGTGLLIPVKFQRAYTFMASM